MSNIVYLINKNKYIKGYIINEYKDYNIIHVYSYNIDNIVDNIKDKTILIFDNFKYEYNNIKQRTFFDKITNFFNLKLIFLIIDNKKFKSINKLNSLSYNLLIMADAYYNIEYSKLKILKTVIKYRYNTPDKPIENISNKFKDYYLKLKLKSIY